MPSRLYEPSQPVDICTSVSETEMHALLLQFFANIRESDIRGGRQAKLFLGRGMALA
jgi:hypothetical protein